MTGRNKSTGRHSFGRIFVPLSSSLLAGLGAALVLVIALLIGSGILVW